MTMPMAAMPEHGHDHAHDSQSATLTMPMVTMPEHGHVHAGGGHVTTT